MTAGRDDQVVKGEFHLPVGQEVEFVFRSRDVIHSAFMPHFRAQMNSVPGVPTRFKMTPTITTDSMQTSSWTTPISITCLLVQQGLWRGPLQHEDGHRRRKPRSGLRSLA